jgi:hypothetical protein
VRDSHVTVNLVNPGWCHSELMRDMSNPVVGLLKRVVCRTTEVGSRTLVHAGLQGPETHGRYLSDCKVGLRSDRVRSLANCVDVGRVVRSAGRGARGAGTATTSVDGVGPDFGGD